MRAVWYLVGFEERSQRIKVPIRSLPFSIGRRSSCDLSLNSKMVSQYHAEIVERDGGLSVYDPGSTNGTFVNNKRLEAEHHAIRDGDILHFANLEFKVVCHMTEDLPMPALSQTMKLQDLVGPRMLRQILDINALRALFQPLVGLPDGAVLGYEALGRGTLADGPSSAGELFETAEEIGLATELSVQLRNQALVEARDLPCPRKVFLNTHPSELSNPAALLASLEPLKSQRPAFDVVLEIHEAAITDIGPLRELRCELDELGIGVAFDDFGTGQARLLEIAEAAPHYLKFDAKLIRDIHLEAKTKQQEVVGTLVRMVLDMGIEAIAEGVERLEEAEVCLRLGFQYGQGYLFGRPAPPIAFTEEVTETEVP